MYEEITKMTDSELQKLEEQIIAEKDKRAKREATEALNEMTALIQKWADKHISFYVYDDNDNQVTIYSREVGVERGWI